jgi:integrase
LTKHQGIEIRHKRACASRAGETCKCKPTFQAQVWSKRDRKPIKKTFDGIRAAERWRSNMIADLAKGTVQAASKATLRETAEAWLESVKAGITLTRSGRPYKPSVVRSYEADLRNYVFPELGGLRLSEVRRVDVQNLADRLLAKGLSASKVHNVVMPLRAIYRRPLARGEVQISPTTHLELPTPEGRRDRIASPTEAEELLTALPIFDRALWATAFYGGLRRGELRGLRWDDVDFAEGIIRIDRAWDEKDGAIEPKSRKGRRTVPIAGVLRAYLAEHKLRTGRDGQDFVFGSKADHPFTPTNIRKRSLTAWKRANAERRERGRAELVPIGLHECRHTYVTMMFDAGLSLERIGDYVGHSSAFMTDRYRHLQKGHESEAAKLLDDYLARANTAGRIGQIAETVA